MHPALPLVAALAALPLAAASSDDAPKVARRAWEHESSDLAPDPAIRFGALKNGIRFAWRKNSEPKQRCCVWMHVDVGSVGEEEKERGMAHFLEHMAFNGSEHFAPGTLVQWLQEHGLEFGADSNAHTGFSETVFNLNLPASDEKSVREGLLVLSDMAGRLTLSQQEIDAEKGVIDGEERERDSPAARLGIRALQEFYAGTRLADRIPIGLKDVRAAFDADGMRAFYAKWYRPENLTVIIVGDLGELDPEPLIAEAFESIPVPATPWAKEPEAGAPRFERPFYALAEHEVPIANVTLGRFEAWKDRAYDRKTLVVDLPTRVACAMLNRRFQERAKAGEAPYLQAAAGLQRAEKIAEGASLSLAAEPAKWKDALMDAELELRSAIQFGFQDEELRVERADRLRSLDEAVRRASTRSSTALASELAAAAESRFVPTEPATLREVVKPALEALTPESCRAALAAAWSRGVEGVQCLGNVDLGADPAGALREVLEQSRKREPTPPQKLAAEKFAYASDPAKKGAIAGRGKLAADVTEVRFENGVRALLKPTDYKKSEVRFTVEIGEGELSSPPSAAALRFVASHAMNGAGLEAHDEEALHRVLAGRSVGVGFGIGESAFTLSGTAASDDLLLGLELADAYVRHCGWRDDGLKRLDREAPQQVEALRHSLDGPYQLKLERELYGGDPRFGFPPLDEVLAVDMKQVRGWIEPQLRDGPITLALVGDFDLEATIGSVAATFGTLPPRRARAAGPGAWKAPALQAGARLADTVDTKVEGGLVIALFACGDGLEPAHRRDVHFLARVLRDRLINEIREKLGASYSPVAFEDLSLAVPGMGRMMIRAEGDPTRASELADAVVGVAASIATAGVTDEEVARLKEPLMKELRDQRRQNRFWLSALERLHVTPAALDDALAAEAYYEKLDAKHLTEVAKRCFDAKAAGVAVVTPKSGAAGDSPPETGKGGG